MSNGIYGTVKPAIITSSDVDIYYNYRPSRSETDENFINFKTLSPSEVLTSVSIDATEDAYTTYGISDIPGLYNLKLPLAEFSKIGIYTIYIRPKEIYATVQDVNVLSAFPDVKGIVLNYSDINADSSLFTNGSLVGYRVDYFKTDNTRQDYFRIVTSNNKVEPVSENTVNGTQKSIRYRFNDASNLVFLELSPSTAPNIKPNANPFIGEVNQKIALINTKFNPIMLEIEMVENDEDTLALGIFGDQIRSLDNGTITTYTKDKEIYNQTQTYQLKDEFTGADIYQVRENKGTDIDTTKEWNTIMS